MTESIISTCCQGAKDIDGELIICQDFCNGTYHPECSGANVDFVLQVINHRQTFWLCKSCATLMNDMRLRRCVKSAYQSGQDSILGNHEQLVDQLKREIITEVKSELQINFARLINSSSHTPLSANKQRNNRRTAITNSRRLFQNNPQMSTLTNKDLPLAIGNDASPSLGNFVAPRKTPRFWLYLSRAARNVTVEQVTTLATNRLGTADIEVFCLVAKGKDINRMNFISFKIGMHPQLKEKALSLTTWPAGLLVREFEKRSNTNENFWEPEKNTPGPQNEENAALVGDLDTEHTLTRDRMSI